MDSHAATSDLEYIRDIVGRASQRIDPHLFHTVHWGAIVLASYPILTWLFAAEKLTTAMWVGISSGVLGVLLSAFGEFRLRGKSRVKAGNTHIESQVGMVVLGTIAPAVILSIFLGAKIGPYMPTLWGFDYAILAWMIGVVYRKEWLWSGLFIFAGALASLFFVEQSGYILGPCMGLGMILPGVAAELRVRRMRKEDRTTDAE